MTEAHNEFIKGIASMFNVTDEKVIKYEFYIYFKHVNCVKCQKIIKKNFFYRKSVELITLLNLKPQLNCSGTCKGVICLDIASSLRCQPLSKVSY